MEEYAPFLAEAIRQHLDEEWMEQACHKEIGNEVAKIFRAAVTGVSVFIVKSMFSCRKWCWVNLSGGNTNAETISNDTVLRTQ